MIVRGETEVTELLLMRTVEALLPEEYLSLCTRMEPKPSFTEAPALVRHAIQRSAA